MQIAGHFPAQLLEPLLDRQGDCHRVGRSLTVEIDLHHLSAPEPGDFVAVAMAAEDPGHILHPDSAGVCLPYHGATNLFKVFKFVHRADEVDGIEIAKGTTGLIDILLAKSDGEVGRRQPERSEAILIGFDNDLCVKPAPDLGGSDSDHRLEPRFEPAVGELAQFVEIAVTVETEPHDGLERRIEAEDAWNLRLAWQFDQSETFANIEAGGVHRLAPLEFKDDF
jgi:hypothetical protein